MCRSFPLVVRISTTALKYILNRPKLLCPLIPCMVKHFTWNFLAYCEQFCQGPFSCAIFNTTPNINNSPSIHFHPFGQWLYRAVASQSYLSHVPLSLLPRLDSVHALGRHHAGRHRTAMWRHHSGGHAHHAASRGISHEAIGHGHPNHHSRTGPHHSCSTLCHHGTHDGRRWHGRAHAGEGLITSRGVDRKLHLRGSHEHASWWKEDITQIIMLIYHDIQVCSCLECTQLSREAHAMCLQLFLLKALFSTFCTDGWKASDLIRYSNITN